MEEAGGSCPKPTKRSIIARPGFGSSGHPIPLLSNHFKVSVNVTDVVFYQYSVCSPSGFLLIVCFVSGISIYIYALCLTMLQVSITAEDNRVVDEKRKIIDRLCQTYSCELAGKSFAYDGEKTLYSLVRLPQSWMEFTVVPKESIAKRYVNFPSTSMICVLECFMLELTCVELNFLCMIMEVATLMVVVALR